MRLLVFFFVVLFLNVSAQQGTRGDWLRWSSDVQEHKAETYVGETEEKTAKEEAPSTPKCVTPCTPCWCNSHPHAACCRNIASVPINRGVVFLLLAGLFLGIYKLKTVLDDNDKKTAK